MKTIRISDKELQNLLVFLGRVELKGVEVSSFNEIVAVLSREVPESEVAASQ